MAINLFDYQIDAVKKMKNGCILCGEVGSGKSITALAYYIYSQKANLDFEYKKGPLKDLYIITTARKRDTFEWDKDLSHFCLSRDKSVNGYLNTVVIDSWNNIKKYKNVVDSFFIFDEQRLVGSGVWVKTFLKIVKRNKWILLTATPGDTWSDYIPVFVANGFYRNKTEFMQKHAVYNRYSKYPKVDRYVGLRYLNYYRKELLVPMNYRSKKLKLVKDILVNYDSVMYRDAMVSRRDRMTGEPLDNIAKLCFLLRKITNSHWSRLEALNDILEEHKKIIVFYNYDFERELIKSYGYNATISEWNGHSHEDIPSDDRWIYLVQYSSGAEGWNCIVTNVIVFYSLSYSYRMMKQAAGRIDRLNSPFKELYYYYLKSKSPIDKAINKTLADKRNFNEKDFIEGGKR